MSSDSLSRRSFLQGCGATLALTMTPVLRASTPAKQGGTNANGPAQHTLSLDRNWLFGGRSSATALEPGFQDAAFARVTLPHTVAPLSWHNWEPSSWEDLWVYRRHFTVPPQYRGLRLFLHFDRVNAGAKPVLNGHALESHLGGFLPFEREITGLTQDGENVLALEVDARWLNVPPSGSPRGETSVDYLLPGGITGSVSLRAVPAVFLRDVFAKPLDVLQPHRRVEVNCRIDAAGPLPTNARISATLRQGPRTLATVSESRLIQSADETVKLTLADLRDVQLWDIQHPHLYELEVTLFVGDRPVHNYVTRIGFRDARFELDGFYLNGRRLQIFGLNRHELFPYVGFAAPDRVQRRDAELLRHQFNCNFVRCSHYPQSEAFLDACDELGLMVWEEPPGWQYIGDPAWQERMVRDVDGMIRRDRNHPSIVIWGVRINESPNDPELYRRTRALAKSLDDSRPTSGTMTPDTRRDWQKEWAQDVFAFDDYHADHPGSVGILPPVEGHPYLIAEAVGQFNYETGKDFSLKYRRDGDLHVLTDQALFHAQAHSKAANYPRCAGVIAWCAFEYASLMNAYQAVKCPGVADVFRLPKLGASFYLAQVDPAIHPVIEPNFYWDFGPKMPSGPGKRAAIFSNCDRLELSIEGQPAMVLHPDRAGFPHIPYPPFFADLNIDGAERPELRIDGYVGNARVLSRSLSSDRSKDKLWLQADDRALISNGSDATRVAFAAADKFGNPHPFVEGALSLRIVGPGAIVGENPFQIAENGGIGAVWIKGVPYEAGLMRIEATHPTLGTNSVDIQLEKFDEPAIV